MPFLQVEDLPLVSSIKIVFVKGDTKGGARVEDDRVANGSKRENVLGCGSLCQKYLSSFRWCLRVCREMTIGSVTTINLDNRGRKAVDLEHVGRQSFSFIILSVKEVVSILDREL